MPTMARRCRLTYMCGLKGATRTARVTWRIRIRSRFRSTLLASRVRGFNMGKQLHEPVTIASSDARTVRKSSSVLRDVFSSRRRMLIAAAWLLLLLAAFSAATFAWFSSSLAIPMLRSWLTRSAIAGMTCLSAPARAGRSTRNVRFSRPIKRFIPFRRRI